jgi:hypothetical protein
VQANAIAKHRDMDFIYKEPRMMVGAVQAQDNSIRQRTLPHLKQRRRSTLLSLPPRSRCRKLTWRSHVVAKAVNVGRCRTPGERLI